jgi:HK97 gp10 family phage protein
MSISVEVKTKQFIDLSKSIPEVEDKINADLSRIGASSAKRFAIFNKGYSTGNLRRSIGYSNAFNQTDSLKGRAIKKGTAEWGTNVDYAPYVEFGTSKMDAQPYMTPSKEEVVKNLDRVGKKYGEQL